MSPLNRAVILPQIAHALAPLSPDIVCLQEVQGQNQKRSAQFETYPPCQHDWLGDYLDLSYQYGQNCTYDYGHHGNAILSRHQLTLIHNLDISVNRFEKRGVLHCQIMPNGWHTPVQILCCHLNLFNKDRIKQYRMIIQYIQNNIDDNAPLILAGDFNDWTKLSSKALSVLGLTEAFESDNALKPTFPATLPLLSLDRIYIKNLSIIQPLYYQEKQWKQLSDHLPIGAMIALP